MFQHPIVVREMFETPEDKIFANFSKVKEEAEALYPDLTICYGGELYYTSDIVEKLEKNLIPRMHNTQFALIEFSARTSWKEIHTGLSNVLRAGVTPIVAHIERYDALEENADRVREIINMGCYTQVNSSHVLKPKLFGDKDKVERNVSVISWKKIWFIWLLVTCIILVQDHHL